MSYIGAEPTTAAFPFDQFSGTGAATSFTLTYAPAGPTSILVAISGVMQNPNLYSVIGTTLSFSPAPPAGTNNISVLYLGLPVIGSGSPGNTAFLSSTDLTATAGQTVFASAGSYTPGFVQVYRNGARLGNADFTATNGTTITLAVGATAGDLVTIEYYTLTSLVNALPLTGGTVTGSVAFNSLISANGGVKVTGAVASVVATSTLLLEQNTASASRILVAGADAGTPPTLSTVLLNNAGGVFGAITQYDSGLSVKSLGINGTTPSSSGAGITFPATANISSNANTLDDYEEGTWSPTFVNWTATTGWFFINSRYVKIGQLVYIAAELSPGSVNLSCPANQAFLGNLPFSVSYPNSPVAWSSNYIDTLGTGVIYAGPAIYAPALNVANSRTVYVTGVYTTAQ